jgi:hypothetical protein
MKHEEEIRVLSKKLQAANELLNTYEVEQAQAALSLYIWKCAAVIAVGLNFFLAILLLS